MNGEKSNFAVDPSKFMSLGRVEERLDGEENTVGIIEDFELGPTTVTYHDVGAKFRIKAKDSIVGDDDSTVFVASDDGELSLGYGPQFDKTIVTNLKRHQLKRALRALRDAGDSYATGEVTVHFDHAGPVVFDSEILVATCPVRFPWDFGSQECGPRGPTGPTVGGGSP